MLPLVLGELLSELCLGFQTVWTDGQRKDQGSMTEPSYMPIWGRPPTFWRGGGSDLPPPLAGHQRFSSPSQKVKISLSRALRSQRSQCSLQP